MLGFKHSSKRPNISTVILTKSGVKQLQALISFVIPPCHRGIIKLAHDALPVLHAGLFSPGNSRMPIKSNKATGFPPKHGITGAKAGNDRSHRYTELVLPLWVSGSEYFLLTLLWTFSFEHSCIYLHRVIGFLRLSPGRTHGSQVSAPSPSSCCFFAPLTSLPIPSCALHMY